MDDSIHGAKRPKAMLVVGALALSAAALAALLHSQGVNRVPAVEVSEDAAARPITPPAPVRTPAADPAREAENPPWPGGISGRAVDRDSRGALGGVVGANSRAASAPTEAPSPAEAPYVVVPDFSGKRLSVARREARALGLRLVARDPYGERVDSASASSYRVRSQRLAVGAHVAPGAAVQVRAREIFAGYGEGY